MDETVFFRRHTATELIFCDVRDMAFVGDALWTCTCYLVPSPVIWASSSQASAASTVSPVKPHPKWVNELGESGNIFAAIRQYTIELNTRFPILWKYRKASVEWPRTDSASLPHNARSSRIIVCRQVSNIPGNMTMDHYFQH